MHQTGSADTQLTGLLTQTTADLHIQRRSRLFDPVPVALHIMYTKRQGRLVDIPQHVAEERFMGRWLDTQSGLGHIVAIRHRRT